MNLPVVTTTTKLGKVLHSIIEAIKENTFTSDDLIISKTSKGTTVNLKQSLKTDGRNSYRGEYDPNEAYAIGDVMRVMPGESYYEVSGKIVWIPSTTPVPAVAGVWICVANVPSKKFSEMVKDQVGYTGYIRQTGVKYYPQWPEPSYVATVQSPNGRYWELISLLPTTQTMCEDGSAITAYVDSYISGSS